MIENFAIVILKVAFWTLNWPSGDQSTDQQRSVCATRVESIFADISILKCFKNFFSYFSTFYFSFCHSWCIFSYSCPFKAPRARVMIPFKLDKSCFWVSRNKCTKLAAFCCKKTCSQIKNIMNIFWIIPNSLLTIHYKIQPLCVWKTLIPNLLCINLTHFTKLYTKFIDKKYFQQWKALASQHT